MSDDVAVVAKALHAAGNHPSAEPCWWCERSAAVAVAALRWTEAWLPCEPCRGAIRDGTGHDVCTGDCMSWCCAMWSDRATAQDSAS